MSTRAPFPVEDASTGTFHNGKERKLYYVKTRNTGSGKVEVHCCPEQNPHWGIGRFYDTEVEHMITSFDQSESQNGSWLIVKNQKADWV